jgi:adenylate kinase
MIAVLFGPPGSGKGTQAAIISERFGMPHVSTGQMLREEVAADTELGREVGPIMATGGLIPDETMVRVIEHRLAQPDANAGVLIDGFPRTVPQARELDETLEPIEPSRTTAPTTRRRRSSSACASTRPRPRL